MDNGNSYTGKSYYFGDAGNTPTEDDKTHGDRPEGQKAGPGPRNAFVTIWLWVAFVFCFIAAVGLLVISFREVYTDLPSDIFTRSAVRGGKLPLLGGAGILFLIATLGCAMAIKRVAAGIVIHHVAFTAALLCVILPLKWSPLWCLAIPADIVAWQLILLLHGAHGASAYRQLVAGFDTAHCRHVYQVMTALIVAGIAVAATAAISGNTFKTYHSGTDDDELATGYPNDTGHDDNSATSGSSGSTNADESTSDNEIAEAQLNAVIAEVNDSEFPLEVDNGITLTRLTKENGYVVYQALCDENKVSIDALRENAANVRENMIAYLANSNDTNVHAFLTLCRRTGHGIGYRFTGALTEETFEVHIPAGELPVD